MVARQTLTLFVWVQILVPQPFYANADLVRAVGIGVIFLYFIPYNLYYGCFSFRLKPKAIVRLLWVLCFPRFLFSEM